MNVLGTITLDMQRPGYSVIYAVQFDKLTRQITAQLTDKGLPWTVPSGALMMIRYSKPDGTHGFYDTLEDGTTAYTISGSAVTFTLAQQALAAAGNVLMQLNFYTSGGEALSSFSFVVTVQPSVFNDAEIVSSDYFNVMTGLLTQFAGEIEDLDNALRAGYGAPLKAATVSAMTDHAKIYVYTGSETGYTAGHWYYYNGTAWTDGGTYNAVAVNTDTTLTLAGVPADAKATGDAVSSLKSELDNLMELDIPFSVSGVLNAQSGAVVDNANYACTELIELTGIWAGIGYTVKSYNNIAVACLYNDAGAVIANVSVDSSTLIETSGIVTNFNGARYIRLCSNVQNGYVPKLYYSSLKDIKVLGKAIGVNNVTFSEHDNITNLIDLSKCSLGYINGATDGSVHYSTTMYVTDFIPLEAGKQYYYNGNYLFSGYYAFYDSDKVRISGGGSGSGAVYLSSPFTPPVGTAYGRFTIVSQDRLANAWLCETNQMATKPADYAEKIKTEFVTKKPTFYDGNEISVFAKILCIGDSLTDGAFNESGGSRLIMRNRAFPAKLQALTGVECTNLGHAGYTSAQWYEAYENEDVSGHDACIIQLGVNDALNNVSETDMDAALTSIVTKVKNENNGIKIFIATIIAANSYMTAAMQTRSQMIRDFVSSLNDANVYLVDLWTYGRTDDYLAYDAGHLSALGYLRLAEDYKAYISYIIHNNPNDFRYVQFIGTNYTYSADTMTRGIYY